MDELNQFYEYHMKDCFMIGVHIRFATVHAHEVPGGKSPSLNQYMQEVNKLLQLHHQENTKIFIASDSHYVINQFKNRYGNKLLYIDAHRANHAEDPGLIYENSHYWTTHPQEFHARKPGYFGGKSALLDCLLLSKCNIFIHTTSNVAATVVFFNPYIDSVYLPKDWIHTLPIYWSP